MLRPSTASRVGVPALWVSRQSAKYTPLAPLVPQWRELHLQPGARGVQAGSRGSPDRISIIEASVDFKGRRKRGYLLVNALARSSTSEQEHPILCGVLEMMTHRSTGDRERLSCRI